MLEGVERFKLAVIGLGRGVGAGFVATCLSRVFADMPGWEPALLELGGVKLYDSMAMDKHFAGRNFFDFFDAINSARRIRGIRNDFKGVNWALRIPGNSSDDPGLLKMLRMANNISGNIIISKISRIPERDLWEFLMDMDRIVAVIDPLPSLMLSEHKLLCELRTSNFPVTYVINKMNGGVSRRDLLAYLKIKDIHYIPMLNRELIYGAEYSCKPLWDSPEVTRIIGPSIEKIALELLN